MPRVAVLIGTGFAGEDVLHKPFVHHLEAEVHVASRIDPEAHFQDIVGLPARGLEVHDVLQAMKAMRAAVAGWRTVYADPGFTADISPDEVDRIEAWMGVPFAFIASMNRLFVDRRTGKDARPGKEVRTTLARYVRFFRRFYEDRDIEWLATTIEDDLYCLAAYFTAKRCGVRVVGTLVSRFPPRGMMFCEDFQRILPFADDRAGMDDARALYAADTVHGDAPKRTQGYWDLAALPRRIRDAWFAKQYTSFRERAIAVSPAEALIIPPAALMRRALLHARQTARRLAVTRAARPPADEPYVFYPLHFADDAPVSFREPFLDQLAVVRNVARSLPGGVRLYVKPHPHYHGTDLDLATMKAIRETPGVRLIQPDVSPLRLVRGAKAVVTVNSTTGLEALVHGVPLVCLGHDFYAYEPPSILVRDMNDLPRAIGRALFGDPKARQHDAEDFVRMALANTVFYEGRHHGYGFFSMNDEEGKRLATALDEALGRA